MIQSAVFKLTLWYLGIIMALSALFSLALYRVSFDQLAQATEHQRVSIARLPLPLGLEDRRTDYIEALYGQLNDGRQQILFRLTLLNLITLLLGGAASYFLARRTLKPIQDSLEAQGRFTADASHELRTPLTAMRAEIEVALRAKQLSSEEARELLSSNLEEIAKLESLSASLLRLAQFENNLDPSIIKNVKTNEIFEEAIHRLQSQITSHHISLDISTKDEIIAGDQPSLVELVVVLLENAIKYSPPHSTVTLRSRSVGPFVLLTVADQGVGMKASDIPFIFHRFYRADRSRTKGRVNGYGLGLSIAKRIVDLHHGIISVESKPEKGSTFRIKLPIQYQEKKSLF